MPSTDDKFGLSSETVILCSLCAELKNSKQPHSIVDGRLTPCRLSKSHKVDASIFTPLGIDIYSIVL